MPHFSSIGQKIRETRSLTWHDTKNGLKTSYLPPGDHVSEIFMAFKEILSHSTIMPNPSPFYMVPKYPSLNRVKQHNAFSRTWRSVLSIDKLVTWQHLSVEGTGPHGVLKSSCCFSSLFSRRRLHRIRIGTCRKRIEK